MKSLPGLKMTFPYWSQEEDKPAYIKSMRESIENFINELKTPDTL